MSVTVGIHQPNLIPWLPFFYKMARCDKFVLLTYVEFSKNGFQNRFKYKDKWITKAVSKDYNYIFSKKYADGQRLAGLNIKWIRLIAETLGIKTHIYDDSLNYEHRSSHPTQRLISLVKEHKGDTYVTNPTAKDKYLDEHMFIGAGLDIEYCECPKHLRVSLFEAFEIWGIDKTAELIHESRESKKVLQGT